MPTAGDKKIKCLVWDLDNTLWDGVLLEDDEVTLRDQAAEVVRTLDERGILQSIASRNDPDLAMAKLEAFGMHEYFLFPHINWNPKSASVASIAEALNIGIDSIAFIDDQPFELEEVAFAHPEVLCIPSEDLPQVTDLPAMNPRFITKESRHRRRMYQADIDRKKSEQEFQGTQVDFLASLGMRLTIAPAQEEDLKRAEELTIRTHQLNTTGYTYSYQELEAFRKSDTHHLWIAGLEDKYGDYGKIGLALVEVVDHEWWIRLLLMSCRVMSRGIGSVFINFIRNRAREANARLFAEMLPNDRNRMMYMAYKFAHFEEVARSENRINLENDLSYLQVDPDYLELRTEEQNT